MNRTLEKTLRSIGLDQEETAVYLAGLELGPSSVQRIAQKAGVKRPTCYKLLANLKLRGLYAQTFLGKKRLFVAESPDRLLSSLRQREDELKQIMPELKSLYNIGEFKPKIKFYEGINGALSVYDDILDSSSDNSEILSYTSIAGLFKDFPKDYAQKFFDQRVKRNIKTRIIARESDESRNWETTSKYELRDIILIPKDNELNFFGDTEIYGDKVALISYRENFTAVIIESREIANMQRFIFEIAWSKFKPTKALKDTAK